MYTYQVNVMLPCAAYPPMQDVSKIAGLVVLMLMLQQLESWWHLGVQLAPQLESLVDTVQEPNGDSSVFLFLSICFLEQQLPADLLHHHLHHWRAEHGLRR